MIIHIPTGLKFENRLQAKIYFGNSDFNHRCRNKEFTFHDRRKVFANCSNEIKPI